MKHFQTFGQVQFMYLHPIYLSTMTELISLLFALVGSDEQLESMLEQQSLGDVRPEVAASSSEGVGTAALLDFGVTPQYVHYLQERGKQTEVLITFQLGGAE